MILIGSRAIRYWFSDFPREPKDWDYIASTWYCNSKPKTTNKSGQRIEYHDIQPLFDYIKYQNSENNITLSPNDLYTLKISHIFWDIKWEKHMFDIVFLKSKGCTLDMDLFNRLYKFWQKTHGEQKKSNLKLSKEDFFDNVLKEYDHDYLHTLINPSPTYLKVLKENSEVEPGENKFNLLNFEEKLNLVREEIYVMAYERIANRDYRTAYSWMLKKFIIHHAPIWEAIFICENFKILHKPQINYKQLLDNKLKPIL